MADTHEPEILGGNPWRGKTRLPEVDFQQLPPTLPYTQSLFEAPVSPPDKIVIAPSVRKMLEEISTRTGTGK